MYDQEKVDDFIFRSETLVKSIDKNKAFDIIAGEINNCEDIYFYEYITALNFIRNERVLDWIEENIHRSTNIGINWGHLAASSYLSWERVDSWLTMRRPLSLVALDGLLFCTTTGERLNQSLWMRQTQPKLVDSPKVEVIAKRLQGYLLTDNVPRTKNAVNRIIENIYEVKK